MADNRKQIEVKAEDKGKLEGLPMERSPYVKYKYKDVEEYKSNAYATQYHLQPKTNQPPTPSGAQLQCNCSP
ncbi:hypothetical protein CR513_61812, partial [Mucuna pruriens]